MFYAGIDLHKHSITVCVVNQECCVLTRKRLMCADESAIVTFFEKLGTFRAVVEAKASHEWFVKLIEFLALDMVPTSYRPTPRQRDHRCLVRQRNTIQRRITSVKNRIRRVLSNYNADRRDLFSKAGQEYLSTYPLSEADRFSTNQLIAEWDFFRQQLQAANQALKDFASAATIREQHQRESAEKSKELHIEKSGSRHLRWALVEAAWQLVRRVPRWHKIYERLKRRLKAKKAIVAIARRLLGMMVAIMKSGEPFSATHQPA